MIYISRKVGGLYGVVDTSDGLENLMESTEVFDMALASGLDIKGMEYVKLNDVPVVDWSSSGVRKLLPYQLKEFSTPSLVKLRVAYGVELVVWQDSITRITLHQGSGEVSIRLSDYASKCEDSLIDIRAFGAPHCLVTLIVDDNIKVGYESLNLLEAIRYRVGFRLDIRECNNLALVNRIYRHFRSIAIDSIIDDDVRKMSLMCEVV